MLINIIENCENFIENLSIMKIDKRIAKYLKSNKKSSIIKLYL